MSTPKEKCRTEAEEFIFGSERGKALRTATEHHELQLARASRFEHHLSRLVEAWKAYMDASVKEADEFWLMHMFAGELEAAEKSLKELGVEWNDKEK